MFKIQENMFTITRIIILVQSLILLCYITHHYVLVTGKMFKISTQSNGYIMNKYNFKNTSLPKTEIVIISAYWRSGSSFLGDLLQQNDGTFYTYEPFRVLTKGDLLRKGHLPEAFRILHEIINCNFDELSDYLDKSRKFRRFWLNNVLKNMSCTTYKNCSSESFEKVCGNSHLHLFKFTRLTRKQVFQFVETLDYSENVKIVHLFRDLREIYNSRKNKGDWCMENDCSNISY
ncbi:secreted protein-like protein [Leptotrombidium deliense]|uniref:Secreted protein-like protein n=1 Tax=Leptotrombidium deliense TaxID=299467 RepID=A0A443S069_9ACAR|nr:secreted protein-like protein [Leptotrombidium deliense]